MGGLCCCPPTALHPMDPEKPRKCTDVLALVGFLIFWCGMVAVCAYSAVHGDAYRLLYGADSFGNTCGMQNVPFGVNVTYNGLDMTGKPYLFPLDIIHPFDTAWICVESCPNARLHGASQLVEHARQTTARYCLYDVDLDDYGQTYERNLASNLGPCPVLPVYNSTEILRRCIPNIAIELGFDVMRRVFGFLNDVDGFKYILTDIVAAYRQIILLCIFAFIVALAIVFLIRFLARIVVYVIFVLVALGSLAITGALWYGFFSLRSQLDERVAVSNGTMLLVSEASNEHALLVYAIVATVITIALVAVTCCCWSSVGLVADLFDESGRALQAMPCLLLQPLYTFVALVVLFVYWSLVVALLSTSATVTSEKRTSVGSAHVEQLVIAYNASSLTRYMWWFHAVGLVWTAEFLLACQQMIVAGSVAIWFFTRNKKDVATKYPIFVSYKRLFMYHLGSVALGSFIITLVKVPRLILMYLQKKIEKTQNPCLKTASKCCICCLYCIERCLRYLHHNAYTIIAIEGRSFCPAAQQAFGILAANVAYVSTINTVGDFVLFLGKVAVTALTGVAGVFLLRDDPSVHFYAAPLLLACLFAYFIAHCFFSIYEMAIDTLFLCFAEDHDFSDASGEAPFADVHLQEFMVRSLRGERMKRGSDTVDESIPL